MTATDLDPLRSAGLEDAGLLTLAHVIGFFNAVNRVADCLAVDPEPPAPEPAPGPRPAPRSGPRSPGAR